ncbi:MAG TPA: ATP-binding protein [Candidatus Polarisedimenticolia bacterium]|nr:ATP-binding protein [Candidatus Polarisedimenticolia bacterium]
MAESNGSWLRELYPTALRDYLANGGESALQQAYEIGRRAIGEGLGALELLAVHQEALDTILGEKTDIESIAGTVGESGKFLAECLSSFEMTHQGFQAAVKALRRLNELLEEEARKIAHALHDDAGQLLVTVHLALQEASGGLSPRARLRLEKVRVPLDEIEKHLRRLSHELRPTVLDDLGLVPALEFLAQGVAARNGVVIKVEGPRTRLPSPIEIALYRVAQEALRNATKHSRARRVDIRLAVESNRVSCSIRDDGRGFDVAAVLDRRGDRGLGLIGMRERLNAVGGQFDIHSAPGRGTEIRIVVPLGDHHADTSSSS